MTRVDIKSPEALGQHIRDRRKTLGLTQQDLVNVAPFGLTFYSDLENGKGTAQLGKTLAAIRMLGLRFEISSSDDPQEARKCG